MRTVLAVICSLTLLATGYLSLSLVILHPPRANEHEWFPMAGLFIAHSTLTLFALGGAVSARRIGWLLVPGSVAIILVGAAWAHRTVSGPHFEGYALVLGSVLAVQGALTLLALLTRRDFRIWSTFD